MTAFAVRKSRLGNPLFEHALMLLVAGIVVWAISAYALYVLEQAEASVVSATIMNIRSGMRTEEALRIARGQPRLPAGGNPVRFLQLAPAGYVDETELPAEPAPGTWFYRAAEETLYYVPQRHSQLHFVDVKQRKVLAWKLVLEPSVAQAATLKPVMSYRWF